MNDKAKIVVDSSREHSLGTTTQNMTADCKLVREYISL